MLNRLRSWLSDIPIHDPIARRQAGLLQALLIGILIILGMAIILNVAVFGPASLTMNGLAPYLIAMLGVAGALGLLRRGLFGWSIALMIGIILVGAAQRLLSAGLRNNGASLAVFIIPIALSGLLLGRRALLITIGLCIAIVVSTAILEQSGSLALPDSPPPPAATAGMVVLFILIVGLLGLILDQFGITLRSALRDTLLREQELEQSRAALQGRTAELEQEIREHTWAEKALQDSEAQYRNLFENNPHPMWVYDAETLAFLAINDAAIQSYGYTREEISAMTLEDIRPTEDIPSLHRLLEAISDELTHSGTWRHQKKDGTIIDVEITSHGLIFAGKRARLVLTHDITERKQLEAQFLQAQKMESVGRLAGGVAHDFNNLLTAIVGNLELALEMLPPDHPACADLHEIEKAAERATSLTRQLLTFARTQAIAPRVLNLNDLIDNMDKLLRRLIGEDIDLVTLASPDLAPVRADPGQIEQVIVNLAVNARDAMPEGGKLTIETRNIVLAQSYARQHVGVTPGPYVLLAISDTGIGMDEETQRRIFEPFFTTKEKGRGTGLGLATCYGIVKQHGGHIWPYSEVGHGSTFRIYLPQVDEPVEVRTRPDALGTLSHGTETVLLAEDETAVRVLAARVLRDRGYTVLEAADGDEALRLAREHGDATIDLLLTDLVMPHLSGRALAEQVAGLYPGVKVLFISGYADNAVVHHDRIDAGVAFLHKPFSPSTLARKVREVLDS